MSPTQAAASARRYRNRHTPRDAVTAFPADNLLWRDPKVPLRREEATMQLELLGPENFAATPPPGPPDPERLMLERVARTIQDTLAAFRPQLNRTVREVKMHLQVGEVRHPDHQVVDETLAILERHLQRFVTDAVASKTWAKLNDVE